MRAGKFSRRFFAWFAMLQAMGEICSWSWPYIVSPVGPYLWVTSIVLLIPGNFVSTWIIQKLFWTSSVPITYLRILQVPTEVVLNGFVWVAFRSAWQALARRTVAGGVSRTI